MNNVEIPSRACVIGLPPISLPASFAVVPDQFCSAAFRGTEFLGNDLAVTWQLFGSDLATHIGPRRLLRIGGSALVVFGGVLVIVGLIRLAGSTVRGRGL